MAEEKGARKGAHLAAPGPDTADAERPYEEAADPEADTKHHGYELTDEAQRDLAPVVTSRGRVVSFDEASPDDTEAPEA